jgi:hypothetical protein
VLVPTLSQKAELLYMFGIRYEAFSWEERTGEICGSTLYVVFFFALSHRQRAALG